MGPCDCIKLMCDFEKGEVSFETERSKQMHLQNLEVLLKSGLMPEIYVRMSYNFLVGCLWIRFAPIFNDVYNGISAAIRTANEKLQ